MKKIIYLFVVVLMALPFTVDAQSKTRKSKQPTKTTKSTKRTVSPNDIPTGHKFIVQSAKAIGHGYKACWDIGGHPKHFKNGMNIKVWDLDSGPDRYYRFERIPGTRYYYIVVGNSHNMVVDLSGNNVKNGGQIHVWTKNGSDAQKFYVRHQGGGQYKIYHKSGYVVCLAGRNTKNGTNVHLWGDHTIPATQWVFRDA